MRAVTGESRGIHECSPLQPGRAWRVRERPAFHHTFRSARRREARLRSEAQDRIRSKYGSHGMSSVGSHPSSARPRQGSDSEQFVRSLEQTGAQAAEAASKAWGVLSSAVSMGFHKVAQEATKLGEELQSQDIPGRFRSGVTNLSSTISSAVQPQAASAGAPPQHSEAPPPPRHTSQGGGGGGGDPLEGVASAVSAWFSSASSEVASRWGSLGASTTTPAQSQTHAAPRQQASSTEPVPARTASFDDGDAAWLAEEVPTSPQPTATTHTSTANATTVTQMEEGGWDGDDFDWDAIPDTPAPAPATAPAPAPAPAVAQPATTSGAQDDDFFDNWD